MITEPIAAARELAGRGPRGMWWVAWRQHRLAVLVSLSAAAVLAGAYLIFGLTFRSALATADLTPQFCEDQWGSSYDGCAGAWARVTGYGTAWAVLRVPMLVLPVLVGVLVVGIGYTIYTDLVPHDRIVYAADRTGWMPMTDGSLYLDDGFLDAEGNTDAGHGLSCSLYGPGTAPGDRPDSDQADALWQQCLDRAGIVARYTDYLDPGRGGLLMLVVGAICAVLAAAGLTLGWMRVRRRVL